jgi:hypothetical protein
VTYSFSPLRKVYIRHKEAHPDSPNTFAALDGFQQLGVETAPFYGFGDIETFEDLGPEVAIVGFVGDVQAALKKMGIPSPEPIDYPEELSDWLHRDLRLTTLGAVRRSVEVAFIKPVAEKLFTGFVWRGPGIEAVRIATCADDVEIWVSTPVSFVSEYRCFVLDDEILGVKHYKGDWSRALDRVSVEAAVKAYRSSPRAYALDFGVMSNGYTALVEVNDAYALGHYGLMSVLYARLIEARWEELTR